MSISLPSGYAVVPWQGNICVQCQPGHDDDWYLIHQHMMMGGLGKGGSWKEWRQKERNLAKYAQACRKTFGVPLNLSTCLDGARVSGRKTVCGIVAEPGGQAAIFPPQAISLGKLDEPNKLHCVLRDFICFVWSSCLRTLGVTLLWPWVSHFIKRVFVILLKRLVFVFPVLIKRVCVLIKQGV
jgi:hypothetical protein